MTAVRVISNKGYNPADNKHYEGAYAQGNGYLNVRASFEEILSGATQGDVYWRLPANVTLEKARHPVSKWGLYVPGIYGKHPILGEEIVNLPYGIGMNLYHANERLDMELSSYDGLTRSLNMSNGLLKRSLVWHRPTGDIEVVFRRYCSLQYKHMIVQEVQLTSAAAAELEFESFMDAGVTTNGYNHFTGVAGDCRGTGGIALYATTDTNQQIGMLSVCAGEGLGEPIDKALDAGGQIKQIFRNGWRTNSASNFQSNTTRD